MMTLELAAPRIVVTVGLSSGLGVRPTQLWPAMVDMMLLTKLRCISLSPAQMHFPSFAVIGTKAFASSARTINNHAARPRIIIVHLLGLAPAGWLASPDNGA
jgi:hypothetical protein